MVRPSWAQALCDAEPCPPPSQQASPHLQSSTDSLASSVLAADDESTQLAELNTVLANLGFDRWAPLHRLCCSRHQTCLRLATRCSRCFSQAMRSIRLAHRCGAVTHEPCQVSPAAGLDGTS